MKHPKLILSESSSVTAKTCVEMTPKNSCPLSHCKSCIEKDELYSFLHLLYHHYLIIVVSDVLVGWVDESTTATRFVST